jgi:hypothetical protein
MKNERMLSEVAAGRIANVSPVTLAPPLTHHGTRAGAGFATLLLLCKSSPYWNRK